MQPQEFKKSPFLITITRPLSCITMWMNIENHLYELKLPFPEEEFFFFLHQTNHRKKSYSNMLDFNYLSLILCEQ